MKGNAIPFGGIRLETIAIFHKKESAKFMAMPKRRSFSIGSYILREYQNNLPMRRQ
jgi:hypothetical protein